MNQHEFFAPAPVPALPNGMLYQENFLTAAEEIQLLQDLASLPFCRAHYKEWTANRRIVSFGGRYDFTRNELLAADPAPPFLHPLRERVARWSGIAVDQFHQALVSEYRAGTQLGWHRDAPAYGRIVGVSLAGMARMRLRPYPPAKENARATHALDLKPRSVYILQGESRRAWQHAISPTKALRYSITFRTLAA